MTRTPFSKEETRFRWTAPDYQITKIKCEKVRNEKNEMIEEHHHVLLDDITGKN
jgi:hypothetical protein